MKTFPLAEHRSQIASLGRKLFQATGIEFAKTSEAQRQICGAFMFGVIFAHGKLNRLSPPDVQALAICMLQDVLSYSVEQAGAFSTRLVQASSSGPTDTTNAIIHRGIDGHRQLTSGENDALRQNLFGIFNNLKAPYEPK
jgi:immunity protein 48 of polymorphic toxin system